METRTDSGLSVISRIGGSKRSLGTYVSPLPPPPPVMPWAGWPQAHGWETPSWGGGGGLLSGYVSTVYSCVDLISRQLATFPTYRMSGTQHLDDVAWQVNPCPELYGHWGDFIKQLSNTILLRGEGIVYALARYHSGSVAQMCSIDPDAVEIDVIDGRREYRIGDEPVDPDDVLHIPYQTWPGEVRGVSPLSWVGRNLISADALEHYGSQLAASGGIPWGVLSTPANLTAAQVDENRQRWEEASARRGAAPVMLSGGLTLDTLTIAPKDLLLLELRVFDEQRICAAFGVPPYLVGLPQSEGLTYANATSLLDFWWRGGLRPYARGIAATLSHWALPRSQRLEFNADEFVRPAFGERAQAYSVMHAIQDADGNPAMTIDEIREAERLAPYSHTPTASANLTSHSVTGIEGTAAP